MSAYKFLHLYSPPKKDFILIYATQIHYTQIIQSAPYDLSVTLNSKNGMAVIHHSPSLLSILISM